MHSDSRCKSYNVATVGRSSWLTTLSTERLDAHIAEKNTLLCSMFARNAMKFCEAKSHAGNRTNAPYAAGAGWLTTSLALLATGSASFGMWIETMRRNTAATVTIVKEGD